MALTLTFGGVDLLGSYVDYGTLSVTNTSYSQSGVLTCNLNGAPGAFTVTEEMAAVLANGATTYYSGIVRNLAKNTYQRPGRVSLHVDCQDVTTLLVDNVVTGNGLRETVETDAARIAWLISTYCTKGITVGAEVQTLVAAMPSQDYTGKTLTEAIGMILALSGGQMYVDYGKKLHTFLTEAYTAPFNLSDVPNLSTTFGYINLSLPSETIGLRNAIYYIPGVGGDAVPTWYLDATSIATYGRRETAISDPSITVQATLDKAGTALLALNKNPVRTGTLTTYTPGLAAGQIFQLTNADYGVSAVSYRITQVITTFPTAAGPTYQVSFGDPALTLASMLSGITTILADIPSKVNAGVTNVVFDLSAGGGNLVLNSSAESLTSSAWTLGSIWGLSSVQAFNGTTSWAAICSGTATGTLATTLAIPVARTDDYWFSFWSYLSSYSAGSAKFDVLEYDNTPTLLATNTITLSASEAAWTRHWIHLGPNDASLGRIAFNAATTQIKLQFHADTTPTLSWYVDAVQAERGSLITAYSPTPIELIDGSITSTLIADNAVTTPKLIAGAVVAGKIAAGAVTASTLAATLILGSRIVGGVDGGPDVELSAVGLRAYDSGGNLEVSIPTDGVSPVVVTGELEATSLLVPGTAEFDGVTTFAKQSTSMLAAGVLAPSSAPVLASGWTTQTTPAIVPPAGYTLLGDASGYYDASGGASGSTPCYVEPVVFLSGSTWQVHVYEWKLSDGTLDRDTTLTGIATYNPNAGIVGITRIGANWYIGAEGFSSAYQWLWQVTRSTGALVFTNTHGSTFLDMRQLTTDGTHILWLDATTPAVQTWNTGSPPAYSSTKTLTGVSGAPFTGLAYDGTFWWANVAAPGGTGVVSSWCFTISTGAVVANRDFPTLPGYQCLSLIWNGTTFLSIPSHNSSHPTIYTHTLWDWTTASSKYWVGYSWYDDVGTTHETGIGARASIVMGRRMQVSVSTPGIPVGGVDDPDKVRVYMVSNSSTALPGSFWLQATDALTVRTLTNYTSSGTNDGGGTAFPGGSGATFASADGSSWRAQGNGVVHLGGTGFPSGPVLNDHFWRSDVGLGFYFDGTRWLSEELFVQEIRNAVSPALAGLSASAGLGYAGPVFVTPGSDTWIDRVVCQFDVLTGGTALGASHNWVGTISSVQTGAGTTTVATITINSGSSAVWRTASVTVGALLGTASFQWGTAWAKTGTPGTLVASMYAQYRVVAV